MNKTDELLKEHLVELAKVICDWNLTAILRPSPVFDDFLESLPDVSCRYALAEKLISDACVEKISKGK